MTYTPTIYDWRENCAPIDQVFHAGGQDGGGGITLGGAFLSNPEPGGRAKLDMRFAAFVTPEANRDASWTISRIKNGAVMRIHLYNSVQLVQQNAIVGIYSDNTDDKNHSPSARNSDPVWRPKLPLATNSAKGSTVVTVDFSTMGPILEIGHLVGFYAGGYDFAHVVTDIEYSVADVATITIDPPLRRAVTSSSHNLHLRPSMLVTCMNANEVVTNFTSGRHMQFEGAKFVEALV